MSNQPQNEEFEQALNAAIDKFFSENYSIKRFGTSEHVYKSAFKDAWEYLTAKTEDDHK